VEKVKQALDRRFLRGILRKIPGGFIDVLDVGGGTGWMLDLLKSTDPRVSFTQVVDMDPKAGKLARAKGHAYYRGPIESFRTGRKFHLVLLFNLIEHVRYPVRVLRQIEGFLAPRGILLAKTPNTDSLDARLFRHLNWGGYHCPRHWVLFNEAGFRKAVEKTRFKISSLIYTQGAPFWAQSVMMALWRWKLIRISRQRPLVYHPLFPLLAAFFAGVDFLRGLFFKTSQMLILLRKPS
jgi:SAM-dependent methyltransferase